MSTVGSGLMMVMNSNHPGSVLPSAKNHVLAEPGGGSWAAAGAAAARTGTSEAATETDSNNERTRWPAPLPHIPTSPCPCRRCQDPMRHTTPAGGADPTRQRPSKQAIRALLGSPGEPD